MFECTCVCKYNTVTHANKHNKMSYSFTYSISHAGISSVSACNSGYKTSECNEMYTKNNTKKKIQKQKCKITTTTEYT